jgi:hypothetical protein
MVVAVVPWLQQCSKELRRICCRMDSDNSGTLTYQELLKGYKEEVVVAVQYW